MGTVAPFRRRTYPRRETSVIERTRRSSPSILALLLAAFLGGGAYLAFWNMGQSLASLPMSKILPLEKSGYIGTCSAFLRSDCVVDGDTFYYRGQKIRIADIDAPETDSAQCASEAERGERAKRRLRELLNEAPFELHGYAGRDTDRYGRKLRVVTRGGRSIGDTLIAEGLARRWSGKRLPWCI